MGLKPCLLVVDDEPDLVQSVKDLLRFEFRVLGATRASEGFKILEQENVQVVMSDQRMPEMTGVEFLASLRNRQPDTVRLLFTAYSDLQAVTDAINQGNVYRYITKPFQADELKAVLRQAFDHYNLQADRKRLLLELQQMNQQLEKMNRELVQANELKRAFIKVASHELRTPLTVVCGLSELAVSSRPGEPVQGWLEQIHRASLRLRQRVDQMVDLLQSENFSRTISKQEVDFADLAAAAAEEIRSFVGQRRQRLIVDLPPDLGTLTVDPNKLHDSIVQLLVNAVKFTPDEGTITMTVRRSPDEATIAIADTGDGINPQSITQLFEPFFTGFDVAHHRSGTFEHNRRGMGLGLTIAKAFVEMHGGSIVVQSAVGRGATFTIRLPVG
ncbi:MAG: hybrid sensor histidine kinase/response regulator [Planctomycetota bacterium]